MMSKMMPMMMGKPGLDDAKKDMIEQDILMQIMDLADQLMQEKGSGLKNGGIEVKMEGEVPSEMADMANPVAAGKMDAEEDEDELV